MTKYRIVFWYGTYTSQPFIYDVTDEQVALQVFYVLLEHSAFLLSREDYGGCLYKAKTEEQIHDYAMANNWYYLNEDDDDFWVQWVSPDGFDIYDYLKTKTVRL